MANLRGERDERERETQGIIAHPQPNLVKVKVGLGQCNSVGDIDAYCYEYDHVNNHHMAYGFDNIFKDYGHGQGYDHFHCDYDHDDDVGHKGQMNDHD